MLTRREIWMAGVALAAGVTIGHVATARSAPEPLQSTQIDWNTTTAKPTPVGQVRQLVRTPTATLDELEMHVTTLNPGLQSHPPHRHQNEELVILDSGKLESTSNGKTVVLGPGSVIFQASNQVHSVKNVGDVPATYHVINWTCPGMKAQEAAPAGAAQPAAPAAKP